MIGSWRRRSLARLGMENPPGQIVPGLLLPGAVPSSNGALPGAVLPGLGLNAPPAVNALERHEQELSRMEAEQQAKEEQELLGMSMMFSLAEQQQQQQQQPQPQQSQHPRPEAQAHWRRIPCIADAPVAPQSVI